MDRRISRWNVAVTGVATAFVCGLGMAWLLRASQPVALAALVRSVTTPIALAIGGTMGAPSSIVVIGVIIAGVLGASLGPVLLTALGVTDPAARGLALGAAAHALGTARAGEESDVARAHGTVALTLCGLLAAVSAPWVARALGCCFLGKP